MIELFPELAPGHVGRIKELAREGAYDGVVFHRVIEGFMAQTGDVKFGNSTKSTFAPGRAGMGGSDKPDLKAEFSNMNHGAAPARWPARRIRTPQTRSSSSASRTPASSTVQYTVWGQVIEGMENVDKIKRGEPVVDPDRSCR